MPSEERLVPEVSLDYAFVRRDTDEDKATILVVKDRESKAIMAAVLPMKGACLEEAGEKGAELIKGMGHKGKLLIKTDNEPALKALRDATIQRLDQQILPIKPPVAESASNGVIESGVRTFKGILRVHFLSLEKKLGGVKIPICGTLCVHLFQISHRS